MGRRQLERTFRMIFPCFIRCFLKVGGALLVYHDSVCIPHRFGYGFIHAFQLTQLFQFAAVSLSRITPTWPSNQRALLLLA